MSQDKPTKLVLFSCPFNLFIKEIMGDETHIRISRAMAEYILLLTQNKEEFDIYIQLPEDPDNVNLYNKPIQHPLMWRLHEWRTSTEKWYKEKLRQDRERENRFIFDANVVMIRKILRRQLQLTEDQASILATKWLRENKISKIKFFLEGRKLITSLKEIP